MSDAATIFALSSGAPPAAIGVVRVSGARAAAALAALAGRMPAARVASLRRLRDPGTGETIDRALILWFPGPRTATGEDLAEFHIHGGRAVADAVLAALGRIDGLRRAEAGEFTRRAFANGVIDLAQAEGLADLLAAETQGQRRAALAMVEGALSRAVDEWRTRLLGLAAQVEALLDFADEDDVVVDETALRDDIAALAATVDRWCAAPSVERLRDGIRIVIAGPPNVGKSTLLNRLAGRDAAIVSDIAGTTRDLIDVPVAIDGIPYLLTDTAGLRDSADAIERIGVDRAASAIATADIVLWLGDVADRPDVADLLVVQAQSDRPGRAIAPPGVDLCLSARTGDGLDQLYRRLRDSADRLLPRAGEVALSRRQLETLVEAVICLRAAYDAPSLLLVAEELRIARVAIDRLMGRAGVEDMLDQLFGRFCIGK